jgi:hypothetical protein
MDAGRGDKLMKLFAYSFHVFRSSCHKPVAAQIALIAILGFTCVLPSLQQVLFATVSLSLLGRKGSNMYCDRLLEYINNIQQGGMGNASAGAFSHAIDTTTLLRAMLHVRHAFQAAEQGAGAADDPITDRMLVQARMLQDEILRIIGTDLTVHSPDNPFHHTGNSVPRDGDFRERRPEEWWRRTAEGRSMGKGRARPERWDTYVRRFVFERFFPF